ncbi:MAG: hypothetical protein R3C15_17310 [Thermoleophilia bacterium]
MERVERAAIEQRRRARAARPAGRPFHGPARGHLWPTNRQVWAIARALCRAAAIDFPGTRDEASELIDALRAATARLDAPDGSPGAVPGAGERAATPSLASPVGATSRSSGPAAVPSPAVPAWPSRASRPGARRAAPAPGVGEEDDVPTYG